MPCQNGDPSFNDTEPLSRDRVWAFLESELGVKPKSVECPELWAEYHKIYVVDDGTRELYLRVARPCWPKAKTLNEVACLKWVKENIASCPCPEVIAWSMDDDRLGYEYIIMEGMPGTDLTKISPLSDEDANQVLDQCAEIFVEMVNKHSATIDKVGGLAIENGEIVPGPVLEEIGYEVDDLKFFKHLDYDSLQIGGPFDSMADYIAARLRRDVLIIEKEHLLHMDELKAKINRVLATLEQQQVRDRINSKRLVLAHQDLHLGNMLYDRDHLSAILDWEFSGVTAIDQWVRRNTFYSPEKHQGEKYDAYRSRFFETLKKLDKGIWKEAIEIEPVKDVLITAISLTFWIVTCTAYGTQPEDRKRWAVRLDEQLEKYHNLVASR